MYRKLLLLAIVLLACLALPLGRLAAHQPAAPLAAETEPNDTKATANPVVLGLTSAYNNSTTDVDWFKIGLTVGQSIHIAVAQGCDTSADLILALRLYDANGVLLAEDDDLYHTVPEFIVPATGTYYIEVTNIDDWQEELGPYRLALYLNSAGEPSEQDNVTPMAYGDSLNGLLDWHRDEDYYSFEGNRGELVEITLTFPTLSSYLPELRLFRTDGSYWIRSESSKNYGVSTITAILPVTGHYEMYTYAPELYFCSPDLPYPVPYQIKLDRRGLYVSGNGNGRVDNVPFGANDILARDEQAYWHKVFDGEDVGLTVPLNAFELLPDGSFVMALKSAQNLPGLGRVLPQDVVRFVPSTLGNLTAGTFAWYLRGTDAGLTTGAERIDALGLTPGGDLLVSTVGTANVLSAAGGALASPDEGVLRYQPPGKWLAYYEMSWQQLSHLRFAKEDIAAMTRLTPEARLDGFNIDLLITLDSDYRFPDRDDLDQMINARKGELLGLRMDWMDFEFAATLPTLGFPRAITNLSVGPAWTE